MNRERRQQIFERFQQANPNPTTELAYNSAFELLVAVVLSAQATDVSVNQATEKLYPIANTPETIYKLGVDRLKPYIQHIGLYNTKAKNVIALCKQLIEKHDGIVPCDRQALEALPGVGRKSANVVLNTIFDQPTMPVDTHIFRIANRIKLASGKTPREVEDRLLRLIPKQFLKHAHHWLVLHGRYICTARKPKCSECLIADLCESTEKT